MTERRAEDPRINALVSDMQSVKAELAANTEITKRNSEITAQVAEVLASFRVLAAVAKWVATIGAGILALKHAPDWFSHR